MYMYIGGGALMKEYGFKSVTGTKWWRSYPKCFGFVLKKKKGGADVTAILTEDDVI